MINNCIIIIIVVVRIAINAWESGARVEGGGNQVEASLAVATLVGVSITIISIISIISITVIIKFFSNTLHCILTSFLLFHNLCEGC